MTPESAPSATVNHSLPISALTGAGLRQAVTGVVPPQSGEGRIREVGPTVLEAQPVLAALGKKLIQTIILAPLGWLCLAPLFLKKIAPFVCRRYTLTNRRVKIQRGLKPTVVAEIPLTEIDDVRIDPASVDSFFRSGDLEIFAGGTMKMRLIGVPEPESFQRSILSAAAAWAGKSGGPFLPASAVK